VWFWQWRWWGLLTAVIAAALSDVPDRCASSFSAPLGLCPASQVRDPVPAVVSWTARSPAGCAGSPAVLLGREQLLLGVLGLFLPASCVWLCSWQKESSGVGSAARSAQPPGSAGTGHWKWPEGKLGAYWAEMCRVV